MSDKTQTERLRELLDERGVEYEVGGNDRYPTVFWRVGDAEYTYVGDGRLSTLTVCDYATPEQAVEATLGRGTCNVECFDDGLDEALDGSVTYLGAKWFLSCGHEVEGSERPNFCSTCGAKVEDA